MLSYDHVIICTDISCDDSTWWLELKCHISFIVKCETNGWNKMVLYKMKSDLYKCFSVLYLLPLLFRLLVINSIRNNINKHILLGLHLQVLLTTQQHSLIYSFFLSSINYIWLSSILTQYKLIAMLITDYYHSNTNLGVGMSEGCFIFHFAILPLDVARHIYPTICTNMSAKHQSQSSSIEP